jgi:hypothetical protein
MMEEELKPTAKADLKHWADKTSSKLLCNAILRWEIRFLQRLGLRFLKEEGSLSSTVTATIILTVFLYVFTTGINWMFNHSAPLWNFGTLLASFLSAFALSVVKYLHDTILPLGINNFAEQITLAVRVEHDSAYAGLRNWWKSFLALRHQIPFVIIIGLSGMALLSFFQMKAKIDFHSGSYVLMFLCGVAVGQGGYCALRIPKVAEILGRMPMDLFWLNPANTPWIRTASWVFTRLSLANAFIGAYILVGFLWLKPWTSPMTLAVAVLLLLFTWAVVLYSFFYPHYQLGKIIRAERSRHLLRLQTAIDSKSMTAEEHGATENEIRGMYEIIRVYNQLASSGSSAINTQAVIGLLLSLGVPMLSFAVLLIDIAKRVTESAKPTTPGH